MRQRETEYEWGRGRERGRHRIRNRLQALSWQPRARRGARTRGPRDHDLSRSRPPNRPSHPGAPTWASCWLSWLSIQLLVSPQVMTSWVWDGAPRRVLCWVWSLLKILSLSGAPGWLSRLNVRLRLRSWSHCPWVRAPCRALCCGRLRAWSCFGFCVSLSLCPSPAHALSLCISKINKNSKKILKLTIFCYPIGDFASQKLLTLFFICQFHLSPLNIFSENKKIKSSNHFECRKCINL